MLSKSALLAHKWLQYCKNLYRLFIWMRGNRYKLLMRGAGYRLLLQRFQSDTREEVISMGITTIRIISSGLESTVLDTVKIQLDRG